MDVYRMIPPNINGKELSEIAKRITDGDIIIYPTDSVYAIGCSLSNKAGIERILKITGKKEKQSKLSLICKSIKEVSSYTMPFSNHVFKTMNRYFPGPYTFILKADKSVRKYFDNRKSEIGIRIPNHPVVRQLSEMLNEPIITTSLSKEKDIGYYLNTDNIYNDFQNSVDILIDGGQGNDSVSTVLDATSGEIELIREGLGEID